MNLGGDTIQPIKLPTTLLSCHDCTCSYRANSMMGKKALGHRIRAMQVLEVGSYRQDQNSPNGEFCLPWFTNHGGQRADRRTLRASSASSLTISSNPASLVTFWLSTLLCCFLISYYILTYYSYWDTSTIKFTHLKCAIQEVLIYSQGCATITTI